MKVTWLRQLAKKYGAFGLVLAAVILAVHSLWKRSPLLLLALITALAIYLYFHLGPRESPPPSPTAYRIVDLGFLPGGQELGPAAINNSRQIVGYADNGKRDSKGNPIYHAFLWKDGRLQDIGTSANAMSYATGINDQSQIALTAQTGKKEFRAFLWENGSAKKLPGPGTSVTATAQINNRQQIAGSAVKAAQNRITAIEWDQGRLKDLGISRMSTSSAINQSGDISGSMLVNRERISGFYWKQGRTAILPNIGGQIALAYGMNARGDVVGLSMLDTDDFETFHAVCWNKGVPNDLGTLGGPCSMAEAVNDRGLIVGAAQTPDKEWHAVVWRNGTIVNLDTLAPGNSGWNLIAASAINNRGDIAGIGVKNDQFRGFLLTR